MSYDTSKLFTIPLKNGISSNLAVNGSSTPQIFSLSANANYNMELGSICLLAETATLAIGNKFIDSTIATLINGLLLEAKCDDISFTWQNCKRTRDIIELSIAGGMDMISGSPSLLKIDLWLPKKLTIVKTGILLEDDFIKATVRDDLSSITYLEIFCQGVKV